MSVRKTNPYQPLLDYFAIVNQSRVVDRLLKKYKEAHKWFLYSRATECWYAMQEFLECGDPMPCDDHDFLHGVIHAYCCGEQDSSKCTIISLDTEKNVLDILDKMLNDDKYCNFILDEYELHKLDQPPNHVKVIDKESNTLIALSEKISKKHMSIAIWKHYLGITDGVTLIEAFLISTGGLKALGLNANPNIMAFYEVCTENLFTFKNKRVCRNCKAMAAKQFYVRCCNGCFYFCSMHCKTASSKNQFYGHNPKECEFFKSF